MYLEANAVGHLQPESDTAIARDRRSRLAAAVRDGRLSVVASPILLQELAAIGVASWPAHLRVLGYLRSVAAPHLLCAMNDLALSELRAGHAVRRPETRLGRAKSDECWQIVMDQARAAELTREAQKAADDFLAEERKLRTEVVDKLRRGTPADEAVEPNVWLWWNHDPADHVRSFAERTARAHGATLPASELHRLPAFWRFHAYEVARIALMHARRAGGGLQEDRRGRC